jgi:hypothetical protein
MLRPGAIRRMVREGDTPGDPVAPVRKRGLHELPVLRVLEEPFPSKEVLLGGVDTDELDVCPVSKPVEQSGAERRPPGGLLAENALAKIEIVFDLGPIVALFRLRGIVVANRGIHGHLMDNVANRRGAGDRGS